MAQSLAITAVRCGAPVFRPLPEFDEQGGFDPILGVDYSYSDHASLLARLGRVFGEETLDVRLYAPAELINGDIADDFFCRLGFDITGLQRSRWENTSLTPAASLFLAAVNKHLASHPSLAVIRQHAIDYMAQEHRGTGISASREAVNQFSARFARSNEAVRARWFPTRALLFSPDACCGDDHYCSPAILSEAESFALFGELWGALYRPDLLPLASLGAPLRPGTIT
jgi:hypothetical protein